MPAILYLVPEFVSVAAKNSVPHSGVIFLSFSCVLRIAGFSVFAVFSAFSGFQGSRSGIPVCPSSSAFSGTSGSKSGIPVLPFFRFEGLQTWNSGVTAPATFGAATFGGHRDMPQKCVKNVPKCVLFYCEKRYVPKCVENEPKIV